MLIRNVKATCETCPYWVPAETLRMDAINQPSECRRFPHFESNYMESPKADYWCGEHPNFWSEKMCETAKEEKT